MPATVFFLFSLTCFFGIIHEGLSSSVLKLLLIGGILLEIDIMTGAQFRNLPSSWGSRRTLGLHLGLLHFFGWIGYPIAWDLAGIGNVNQHPKYYLSFNTYLFKDQVNSWAVTAVSCRSSTFQVLGAII